MNHTAEDLRARLTSGATASGVLRDWCVRRFGPGRLVAQVLEDRAAEDGRRHRCVDLLWQDTAVSNAVNIYLPGGLPEDVRHRMLHTAVPFGVLLESAGLVRRTTLARLLPADGPYVLEVHAALALPGQGDVAFVHELYRSTLIG
ncbi:hypothetical protein [Falsirhodobacter deserti]|uniref:hypothetical protein n=1 Tax=Falsirhodobacter deserti TaxID=1365611 RepID=UPI000FE3A17C|nr:hypothetical protein [Falsirhodobacter deserti]